MERYLEKASRPEDLVVAIKAAEAAGEIMNKYQRKIDEIQTEEKTHFNDVVTEADLEAQEKIVDIISDEFPDDGFTGEEDLETDSYSRRNWVIDPIDGTSNFERGLRNFCTSIGLKVDGEYVLGVIYSPETGLDEMYFACKDSGAYRVANGELEEIKVSEREGLESGMVMAGINDRNRSERKKDIEMVEEMMNKGAKFRRVGSAALNIAFVAYGSAESVMYRYLYEWDYAAGKVIVEEAGGRMNVWDARESKKAFLATNSLLHTELKEIFERYRPE